MKNKLIWITMMVLAITIGLAAQGGFGPRYHQRGNGNGGILPQLPLEDVSAAERQYLLAMREEEKLARDVYGFLADRWGLRVFSQIAQSEDRHMGAVKALLDKYDIPDPLGEDIPGVFSGAEFQELYAKLTVAGSVSIAEALTVGAVIEDLDISDLMKAIEASDSQDILTVFQNLVKGSRNHLRTFVSHLESLQVTYVPRYISVELFDAIIHSDPEHGPYDAAGNPSDRGAGWGWND